jgi:gluconolactonase
MILVKDLGNPEGPVLLPDGKSLALVEMHPDRGWITRLSLDGKKRGVIVKTGRPNGMTIDRDGILWVAESVNPPSLLRVTLDGKAEIVLTACDGEPFLFPNDLCFGPDGMLYMTDSGVLHGEWGKLTPDERRVAGTDGRLYRIDLKSMFIEKLDSGIPFANGIAFGPDGYLYANGTLSGMVYRYKWDNGKIGSRTAFGSVVNPDLPESYRGPDGMAFGQNGNLYVAVVGQGDVTVLGPDGGVVRRIQLEGLAPTNVVFGPPGSRKIYVTEQGVGHLEVHDVGTDGLLLYN